MSDPINDGGSIQPRLVRFGDVIEPQGGMSLRDWFAGMALQGWIASYPESSPHPASDDQELSCASLSYKMADAMLAARAKGGHDE